MKEDLKLWLKFLRTLKAYLSFMTVTGFQMKMYSYLQTVRGGGSELGFGAFFARKWTCAHWPQSWIEQDLVRDITVLEMFPLLVFLHKQENRF